VLLPTTTDDVVICVEVVGEAKWVTLATPDGGVVTIGCGGDILGTEAGVGAGVGVGVGVGVGAAGAGAGVGAGVGWSFRH
jgi:hypothetical protein